MGWSARSPAASPTTSTTAHRGPRLQRPRAEPSDSTPTSSPTSTRSAGGQRASRLTRQLLAFSRQQPTTPTVLAAGALLNDSRQDARAPDRRARLRSRFAIRGRPGRWSPIPRTSSRSSSFGGECPRRDAPGGGTVAVETANVTLTARDRNRMDLRRAITSASRARQRCRHDSEVRAGSSNRFFTTKDPERAPVSASPRATASSSGRWLDRARKRTRCGTSVHTYWPRQGGRPQRGGRPGARRRRGRAGRGILVVDDDDGVSAASRGRESSSLTATKVTMAASAEEALTTLSTLSTLPDSSDDVVLTGMTAGR